MTVSLYTAAYECLMAQEANRKAELGAAVAAAWARGALVPTAAAPPRPIAVPGRPVRPPLVEPRELVARRPGTVQGRAAMLHAIAHIEFNAINLAWDAVYRFRGLPAAFYDDWIRVAGEETLHFTLLGERLAELGFQYGDFPAHNGLWEMARSTAHDALVRMALVPRLLEARGLDVTPGMTERLRASGEGRGAEILELILHDEIRHVAAGSRWFRYLCAQRDLEPEATFRELLAGHTKGVLKGPFNLSARRQAGFAEAELDWLLEQARQRG